MNALRGMLVVSMLLGARIHAAQNPPDPAGDAIRPLAVDTSTYQIGPKDLIQVEVWGAPEFTRVLRVRPDGKITLGLVGDVMAGGVTPERLSVHVADALKTMMEEPHVTVSVIEVQSKTYSMSGAVAKPGPYPMPVQIRIFEAINNAGGFSSVFAKKDKVLVIGEDGGDRRVFNYEAFIKGKNLDKNINFFLKNGDTVYVKE